MFRINFLLVAAIFGALAVIFGAFAAHGLEHMVEAKVLQRFHTAVDYQFYHVFALLIVGLLYRSNASKLLQYAGFLFIFGILVFSGSLYAYVLTGMREFGMITPFGGVAFIIAWVLLAIDVSKNRVLSTRTQ